MSENTAPGFPHTLPATPEEEPPSAGLVLNSTIQTQLSHRTIRAFKDEPVGEDVVATLLDVARRTPTCGFYQQLTIIRIKNQEIREQIFEASGQPYVGGNRGELFIFVADLSRTAQIRKENDADLEPVGRTYLFHAAAEDAVLAVQNAAVAAESLGFGTCLLGSIIGDPMKVIKALKLPKYTYPILGLLVGHPDQQPQMKPRLPRIVTTSIDTYPNADSADYQEAMAQYDQTIQTYYDMREGGRRQDSFTHQIISKVGNGRAEQTDVIKVLNAQGLCTH
jgi:Nitroreductase